MFINNFDPVAFSLFDIEIRWYSLSYIFGILFGWFYAKKLVIKDHKVIEVFDELLTYLVLGIIIGGRLGYVVFYNINYYLDNIIEILFIWHGGMSFHGGLIGIIFSTYIFSKKHNINEYVLLDCISITAPIGIFFGRISNFINSELYGKETELPWSVKFLEIDNLNRHPSQLYEAFFEGIVLFFILVFFKNKGFLKIPGLISGLFLVFYSTFRFVIEFFRAPDEQLGYIFLNLTMGQIISLIFFIIGSYMIILKYEKKKKL